MIRINLFEKKRTNHWWFVVIDLEKRVIDQIDYSRWIGDKLKICSTIGSLKHLMSSGTLASNWTIKFLITSGII
ncbi:30S ribosomal protein S16 [Candidatus Hodgkinia cicadicola]|uniref:30S ribosomal protein S16 n=1 Tax=Candidatus Hodgkinia cicadicola TaxID=573658 RepID=A0ABX4MF81_9HYPH|nr:30S ribosomal protein S16 [Candidatus Hodgkinia cicadicola]